MMITFSFDGNEVKADEPLGSVTISDGPAKFSVSTVFLDSFFGALIQAYQQSLSGIGNVELEEEGKVLSVSREANGLKVELGEQRVLLPDAKSFERSLRQSVANFLKQFPEDDNENELLEPLRSFISDVH
jgi:hypothetical protein